MAEKLTIDILSVGMVMIGTVFLVVSLPVTWKLYKGMSGPQARKWRFILYLMGFFILGYLFFDLILLLKLPFPEVLVTGGVFLGGAVFVFLIINITKKTIMERQKAESALQESESCFHTIFDSVNEAIVILDPDDLSILGINDKMCAMFKMSHEEACRFKIGSLGAENDLHGPGEWRERSVSGAPWIFKWQVRDREGRLFWVDVNANAAVINGDKRLLVSMRDISRRQRLEDRIARLNSCFLGFSTSHDENIRRLTALCGELMGGTCSLYNKLEGEFLFTISSWSAPADFKKSDRAEGHLCTDVVRRGGDSPFYVRNLARTPYFDSDPNVRLYNLETYIGMPVRCGDSYVGSLCVVFQKDYLADEEDEKFLGILARAIGVEEERKKADESLHRIYAELELRVLERTAELAGANEQLKIDIAERKKTEEALWKSESILRKVFVAIPDMLAVIDRDLRIVHSNWQGGYEYVPEEVRQGNPHCYDAYYPESGKPCENCHALKVFQTGKEVTSEKVNPRIGLVEVRAFPIFDDSGNVVMVAEYIRNITEKRRVEEELRKVHNLESLGVLAGGIAHDFNNLLTGILGNISLAKAMSNPGQKIVRRLDEAEKAVSRARDLTNQLMTFSKGGGPVKKTASIEQIVRDSASFVLRGSNVRCEYRIDENVWPVEVDEGQISQVINNLIINADQAMPDGGIVEVSIENSQEDSQGNLSPAEGSYVKITIRDHGTGIPEDHLHRIFDPYFTTKPKGSGLGLATVYSIIRNHEGFIKVESQLSAGTTFEIFIPASSCSLPITPEQEENPLAGSGRILVMDDEEIIREIAEEILNHLGYEAVVCSDGREAVARYKRAMKEEAPFSAVILDLTIPGGMGGQETIKNLLELDKGVIGIVSSGYCNDPILASYMDYGFRGIVEKPYSMDELGKVLHSLLTEGNHFPR